MMNRSKHFLSSTLILALAGTLSFIVHAAEFCVNTTQLLKDALISASANDEPDTIKIVKGTYNGGFKFYYKIVDNLSIQGGYEDGCATRTVDPQNTILDGRDLDAVLMIRSSTNSMVDNGVYSIEGITFKNGKRGNWNAESGGLCIISGDNSTASIKNSIIENSHGCDWVGGGALGISFQSNGQIDISENVIRNNVSNGGIGGGYIGGSQNVLNFSNNLIKGNSGTSVGGIYLQNNEGVISAIGNSFIDNSTGISPPDYSVTGGLWVMAGATSSESSPDVYSLFLINNVFQNNQSGTNGVSGGAYIETRGKKAFIANNTFTENSASLGGGISLMGLGFEVLNNLFWDNQAVGGKGSDIVVNYAESYYNPLPDFNFNANNNNFDQSIPGGIISSEAIDINESNLNNINPHFVDINNGDLSLQDASPMIDAGYLATPNLPDFDLVGNPRVIGASVDIGAYEFVDDSDPKAILTVAKDGTGSGTITSSPDGINCGSDCAHPFDVDTDVILTLTADPNSIFDGWSGNADCEDGQVLMDSNKNCTATFSEARELIITKTGEGTGIVSSTPAGIDCGASCNAWFYLNDLVQLSAFPAQYSIFSN